MHCVISQARSQSPRQLFCPPNFTFFLFYITKKGFDLMFIFSRIRKKSWILSGWLHKELLICFEKMDTVIFSCVLSSIDRKPTRSKSVWESVACILYRAWLVIMSSIFYDTWILKMYISHLHSHKRVPKDTLNQMLNAKNISFFLVLVIYIFAYSDILTKEVFSQNTLLINHACIQKNQ